MNNDLFQDASLMAGTSSVFPLITNVRRPWEPVRLTYTKPTLTVQDAVLIARPDLLHKFIIFGIESYDQTEILDTIVAACSPQILLPMLYTVENRNKATFITRCSSMFVKNLVDHGMRIKMADGLSLAIDIILGFVDTNEFNIYPQREINRAVRARYDILRKSLNLDDFKNDEYLPHVYCSISSTRILNFIIRCCNFGTVQEPKLPIRELSLRSNNIRGIAPFEKTFNLKLTKIDLRNNLISDISHVSVFKDHRITELWLDGNPVCSHYTTSEEYVRDVKMMFPYVQKLDGISIDVVTKYVPIMRMSYLGDSSRVKLIKQFIRHFFAFYDQNDRIIMNGLYDQDALYSITLGAITNTTQLQMTKAFASNRNLLKFVDYAKCHEFLLRGPEKIIAALRRQPPTCHNYQKFNIDVLHFSEDSLTIAVQGNFCYKDIPHIPLFFNRTFVIVEIENNEYCIANDQYHIQSESSNTRNIINETKVRSFVVPKIEPTIFSPSEKQQLLAFLEERTTMNGEFCLRYLEQANWDIRAAIGAFMKSYTVNDVPPEAFRKHAYS